MTTNFTLYSHQPLLHRWHRSYLLHHLDKDVKKKWNDVKGNSWPPVSFDNANVFKWVGKYKGLMMAMSYCTLRDSCNAIKSLICEHWFYRGAYFKFNTKFSNKIITEDFFKSTLFWGWQKEIFVHFLKINSSTISLWTVSDCISSLSFFTIFNMLLCLFSCILTVSHQFWLHLMIISNCIFIISDCICLGGT